MNIKDKRVICASKIVTSFKNFFPSLQILQEIKLQQEMQPSLAISSPYLREVL